MVWSCCLRFLHRIVPRNDISRELRPYLQTGAQDVDFLSISLDDLTTEYRPSSYQGTSRFSMNSKINNNNSSNNNNNNNSSDNTNLSNKPLALPLITNNNYIDIDMNNNDLRNHQMNNNNNNNNKLSKTNSQTLSNCPTASTNISGVNSNSNQTLNLNPMIQTKSNLDNEMKHINSSHTNPLHNENSQNSLYNKGINRHFSNDSNNDKSTSTAVLVYVSTSHTLSLLNKKYPEQLAEALTLYEHTIYSRLREYRGNQINYNTNKNNFILSFPTAFDATNWCLATQLTLLHTTWDKSFIMNSKQLQEEFIIINDDLNNNSNNKLNNKDEKEMKISSKERRMIDLNHENDKYMNENKKLLFRGLRIQMGIHSVNNIIKRKGYDNNNNLIFDEKDIELTKAIGKAAHGGQIVISENIWRNLKEQLVQLGNPVVEDLGQHILFYPHNNNTIKNGAEYSNNDNKAIQLMQILPKAISERRFPPLRSKKQLFPGMREAPAMTNMLTMVFTFLEGSKELILSNATNAVKCIEDFCNGARIILHDCSGYECQELQGDFMLAFHSVEKAVIWCTLTQELMKKLTKKWSLQSTNDTNIEMKNDTDNKEELSVSMGIESGYPTSVTPHRTSGRADYFGNIVNHTARIAKAANGGQILMGGESWEALLEPINNRKNLNNNTIATSKSLASSHTLIDNIMNKVDQIHHNSTVNFIEKSERSTISETYEPDICIKERTNSSDITKHICSLYDSKFEENKRKELQTKYCNVYFRWHGYYNFKGISRPTNIIEVLSFNKLDNVSNRRTIFPSIKATKNIEANHNAEDTVKNFFILTNDNNNDNFIQLKSFLDTTSTLTIREEEKLLNPLAYYSCLYEHDLIKIEKEMMNEHDILTKKGSNNKQNIIKRSFEKNSSNHSVKSVYRNTNKVKKCIIPQSAS